jgi:hypothetical protein
MKVNVVAAVVGGLIVGAGAMVPLGSFAQSGTPTVPPTTTADELVTTDPAPEAPLVTPNPTPPVAITPPSFGAGDRVDDDDDDVEYGDDDDEDDDDHEDEDEDEGEDD